MNFLCDSHCSTVEPNECLVVFHNCDYECIFLMNDIIAIDLPPNLHKHSDHWLANLTLYLDNGIH